MALKGPQEENDPHDEAQSRSQNGSDTTGPQMFGQRASVAGILERVEAQFNAEFGTQQLTDHEEQRSAVRDVVDYVFAVESIKLDRAGRFAVIEAAFNDLFGAGPLDALAQDDAVNEITITGHDRIDVRQSGGEMERTQAKFNDASHLERFVQRKKAMAGVPPEYSDPFIEIGATLHERPARLALTGAPISSTLHVDIRLHPAQPLTLPTLIERRMLPQDAADRLKEIIGAGRGLMVAGDVGSGKTTLLQALIPLLPKGSVTVERAAELRTPAGIQQMVSIPPVSFAERLMDALTLRPAWLVLDELRFDEAEAMWAVLTAGSPGPRCLWAVRGATEVLRLRTAFSMAVRRAQQAIEQDVINSALLDRLPFVAMMARRERKPTLLRVGEWYKVNDDPAQLDLRQIWP